MGGCSTTEYVKTEWTFLELLKMVRHFEKANQCDHKIRFFILTDILLGSAVDQNVWLGMYL